MTATTARRQSRIDHLRALIEHPRTPENERAAAIAMLQRVIANSENHSEAHIQERSQYARVYGDKYDFSLSTTQIAARIREEIKIARKLAKKTAEAGDIKLIDVIGDAPAEIKFSVRTQYFSGGSSIDVTLKNIPQDWGWVVEEDRWGYMQEMASPALCALAEQVKGIMNAYNHDGSDSMTDYFDVNFYGHVMADSGRILA